MSRDIMATNRDSVLHWLGRIQAELDTIRLAIESGGQAMTDLFTSTQLDRDSFVINPPQRRVPEGVAPPSTQDAIGRMFVGGFYDKLKQASERPAIRTRDDPHCAASSALTTMIVNRPARIRATVSVPPDKSVSHRAFILNAIADGDARVDGPLDSADVRSTVACLRALGVEIDWPANGDWAIVHGRGLHSLYESEDVLDCGNSGTTMRLLSGLLAAHPLHSILSGDASLRGRPMGRIIAPLRRMGAHIHGRKGDTLAPLAIKGGGLRGIDVESPVASAQVKSAVLLAGLYAEGRTTVREPAPSRDHTERMLTTMGAALTTEGAAVAISPTPRLEPLALRVPGDISSAAPWLVLGACHPDAEILVRGVNTNPTRTGILDILRAMGGDLEVVEERTTGGEPVADIVVRSSRLRGTGVGGALVPRAIDELPLVAVLAAHAEGETVVRDAAELRAKESDRVETVVEAMAHMGLRVYPHPDGFRVTGPVRLHGGRIDAHGDHRIGRLAGSAGALADGATRVEDSAVEVSYPGFWHDLQRASEGAAAAL
jgi:3-phosphoshikimate 1-carboxyvinyltransferase